jgi:type IV secretory pathway VirB10-like protein
MHDGEAHDGHAIQRAADARDVALRRLRRFTGGLIAAAVALTGAFAGVAASSTHPRKVVARKQSGEARGVTRVTTPPLPPAPPAPDQAAAPPPAPAPPAEPPIATPVPPVVVSGGS